MLLMFEIFERAKKHGKKFLKLCQTSFSGIAHFRELLLLSLLFEDHWVSNEKLRFFNPFCTNGGWDDPQRLVKHNSA